MALFIPNLNGGGAERIILSLAEELSTAGYSVDLIVTKHWGKLTGRIPLGVRYVSLETRRVCIACQTTYGILRWLARVLF